MIKAVLFDFNGVIIDDERLQFKAYREALVPDGISLTEQEYFACLGMDDGSFVRAAFERAHKNLTPVTFTSVLDRKFALHRQAIEDELPLVPGVVTLIKALSRRYDLAVVSMAGREEIDYVMNRAHIADAFAAVVSAEDAHACKPDPCCYQRAHDLLNQRRRERHLASLSTRECLVIEDSPPGIEAGKRAGMRTLGVTNTVPEAALRSAGAEVVTASLADWNPDAVHHVFDTG
jgi:beta-phosphoglucomutase